MGKERLLEPLVVTAQSSNKLHLELKVTEMMVPSEEEWMELTEEPLKNKYLSFKIFYQKMSTK